MVRRRARPAKFSADGCQTANNALLPQNLDGAVAVAVSEGIILEDQYFASPKRKECKIDEQTIDKSHIGDKEKKLSESSAKAQKSPGKGRTERGGNNGRTMGVPLATRSQTQTIENFFKTKTAPKSAKIKATNTEKDCIKKTQKKTDEKYAFPVYLHSSANGCGTNHHAYQLAPPLQRQLSAEASATYVPKIQENIIFDLSEDTTDTDNTELSDEYSIISGGGVATVAPLNNISNFSTHRQNIRFSNDSFSSHSSTTDNIFLQEPVLSLNVDKSPNQASSIKINTTLEVQPVFSSPSSKQTSAFNGNFNKIVSLQTSPVKLRDSFCFESLQTQQPPVVFNGPCEVLSSEHDSSSCDSGVAFSTTTSTKTSTDTASPLPIAPLTPRRRKPATPHRIVCPSPIKTPPRVALSAAVAISSSPSKVKKLIAASKDQLSPRKSSQRHQATTQSKSRRKLHQPKEHQAPYHTTANEIIPIGNQNDHIDFEKHLIKTETDDQEFEKLQIVSDAVDQNGASSLSHSVESTQLQQQQKDIAENVDHKITKKTSTKKQQKEKPKPKSHQISRSQPLAATNGNHELTEFFPVRRSVRKTNSAVKEEMMRNLEQAILKNHGDGLKVAYFENKGRGVITERCFKRGEFVVEYVGDLISTTEAAKRETQYALDENAGCYMYYFKHKNQQYCIDATADTGELGRLVNHSRAGNLVTKVIVVKQRPHLILLAKDDIEAGVELTYDYGDRSKESLLHHPWLAF